MAEFEYSAQDYRDESTSIKPHTQGQPLIDIDSMDRESEVFRKRFIETQEQPLDDLIQGD